MRSLYVKEKFKKKGGKGNQNAPIWLFWDKVDY